jgi:hypothetical protein
LSGADVFTGKMMKGRVLPMKEEGVGGEVQEVRNPRRRQRAEEKLHAVRKVRAEVAAYADCNENLIAIGKPKAELLATDDGELTDEEFGDMHTRTEIENLPGWASSSSCTKFSSPSLSIST